MITVILGSRPHVLIMGNEHPHPLEFTPEDLYMACNRIGGLRDDIEHLMVTDRGWAQILRRGLDDFGAPSMSVGDMIFVTSATGQELGGWECMPSGFRVLDRHAVRREDAINGGHLCLA